MTSTNPLDIQPSERLIVALDVPSAREARELVDQLEGTVSFYKVGLELLMAGAMETLLRTLLAGKKVFVDLKLPNDIPETVRRTVEVAADSGVAFLTLSNSVTETTIRAAVEGRRGRACPQLLFVPFLSSQDRSDVADLHDPRASFEEFLATKTAGARAAGVDGFIVSGQEVGLLRAQHPDAVLVSPGIRPAGSALNDHKRSCTPGEAIRLGADYIVVGRPIRDAADPQATAERIIDEIAGAASGKSGQR
jgi:orotidine-5'-phosphate decarboxylase